MKNYNPPVNFLKSEDLKFMFLRSFSFEKKYRLFFTFFFLNFLFITDLQAQGNSCSTASLVAVNTEYSGQTIDDSVVNDPSMASCAGSQLMLRDGWVSFVATGTEALVRITANRNPMLYAYSGTCSNLTLIGCANAVTTSGNQTETLNLTNLIAGNTYLIRIGNVNNNPMTVNSFVILTNNNCTGAIPLTVNAGTNCTVTTAGTSLGATQSLTAVSCGGSIGNADDDVWYSFVATQNTHTITASAGTISDLVLDLRSGVCGSVNIACADNTDANTAETITATGLTIGSTYYIRIYSYGGNVSNAGTFTICVRETNNCIVYAPTSITSPSASVCAGSSTTLTAVGGTTSASTLWFEGNCGNVLFSEEWNSGSLSYPSGQTTVNSISGGVLTVTSHNVAAASADAQIDMQTIFSTAFVPATYKNIAIRYRVVSGDAIACEIYFKKGIQGLAEDKVVRANLNNDNNWHIVNLDMSTNSYWNNTGGNITGWRFDYTRGPNVKMEIDYIALTDRAVLENTNANENIISVLPTAAITDYYALRVAESTCFATTSCSTVKIYRNKTWNGGPTGDWSVASNWIPVGVPTSNDCIDVPSTLTMAITGSHAVGKTLNVSAGNFTVNSGSSVTLQGALTVGSGATFTLQDGASLVQEGTTNTNSGNIIAKRNAKPMKRYDFTYWSSPVSPQTLYNLSPNTLGDKYYSWDADAQAWLIHYNGAVNMVSGKGYIARAPQSYPIDVVNSTNFEGNFTGVPNSGDITIGVVGNATTLKWNLIGNPYPSAILIDEFLTDSFNSSKISGTIYLWTHNSPPTNAIPGDAAYNYTSSDYAAYNGVGGTATSAATANPLHPIVNPSPNPNVPNGYLASGQSFFVGGKSNAASSVKFTNSMREKAGNNQFFRTANSTQNTNDKSRIWINLRNNEGAFNQTLVGYLNGATNEIDDAYDGELFGGNYVSIYSLNSDKNLTIQGRALPFETSDVVPLGLNTTISGTFSISLDSFDGLFLEQDIFLKDKLLNVTHNLKNGGYEFATAVGTFNDRFEIIYQDTQLGINDPVADSNQIIVYKKDKNVFVNSGKLYLESVKVFDIQGKLIHFEDKINNTQAVVKNLPDVNQVLIVQVKTNEGIIVSKKIIF